MAGALSGLGQPACGTYIHDGLDQGTGGAGEVRQGGGQVPPRGLSFTRFVRGAVPILSSNGAALFAVAKRLIALIGAWMAATTGPAIRPGVTFSN